MKVMVATDKTQGVREDDFTWCTLGELVFFGNECPNETLDGPCGCVRSMTGLESGKGTTTMEIVERKITAAQFIDAIIASYRKHGMDTPRLCAATTREAMRFLRFCRGWDVGAVLERRATAWTERIVDE